MNRSYNYSRLILPIFITLFIAWSVFVYARSSGITGRTNISGGAGCTCHDAQPNTGVSVTLTGPDELETNETATYSVTIEGGPLSAAGTNIASDAGTLSSIDETLQVLSGELKHESPKSPNGSAVTFDFEFTAPANEGTVNLEATGLSVNLNGSSSGDAWNHANGLVISVNPPVAIKDLPVLISESFQLEQNYPNPFNPQTTIGYSINKPSRVNLSVYNLLGQKVQVLFNGFRSPGNYNVLFSGQELESGTYIYQLNVDGKTKTRRMLLLK
jgi:hypothetical protein